jgi:glycosyltransferase involved in cell wall biosynthesis
MRILVLTNLYPSPERPAFGTFVKARVEALERVGAQVAVLPITSASAHQRVPAKYADLAMAAACSLRHRRRGFDVVETHIAYPTGLIGIPLAALHGAPSVLFAHGADVLKVPWRNAYHRAAARRVFRAADLVIANSRFLARCLEERFATKRPAVVISPGIDRLLFEAQAMPDGDRAGIVYVGRLIPEKGVDILLRGLALLARESHDVPPLTIAGDGPEEPALRALVTELGIDAVFVGAVAPRGAARLMGHAAVVVVPSNYDEPLGLVPIEAMAAGAIVVATNRGGLTESVIDGQTGILVESGSATALAAGISRATSVALDPTAAARVRAAGTEMARSHDIDERVRDSLRIYAELGR